MCQKGHVSQNLIKQDMLPRDSFGIASQHPNVPWLLHPPSTTFPEQLSTTARYLDMSQSNNSYLRALYTQQVHTPMGYRVDVAERKRVELQQI